MVAGLEVFPFQSLLSYLTKVGLGLESVPQQPEGSAL